MTPGDDPHFAAKGADICAGYREAPAVAEHGARVITTDELTGVQALDRKDAGLPLAPGKVERREGEDIRHGSCAFLRSRDVVTGHGIAPSVGPTRTAADVLAPVQGGVATDPQAGQWHVVVDKRNIHQSEAVVRWVAEESDLAIGLGVQGNCGIVHTQQRRAAFLSDPAHRIVFHSTPPHGSWLNQMESWLRILVRKLLNRGSFTSVDDLQETVVRFIAYSNRTLAKPVAWTYQGKPLLA